jgi:hypothetical protein
MDCALWKDDLDPQKTEDKFRTSYGYVPTLEFFPWKDFNLKFYLGYVGRSYKYSDYAKTRPGLQLKDYTTGRVIIGIISPLTIL